MSGAFSADSSCLVAAVCTWHEHHEAAVAAIETRLAAGETFVVAGHALAETYAVLTRLPPPHRLAPADAGVLVDRNFAQGASVVALRGSDYAALVRRLGRDGVAGGSTYDAIIAACARRGRATALLTFNPRHFDPAPVGVTIVVPAGV